jgi:thioredoxin-related protein
MAKQLKQLNGSNSMKLTLFKKLNQKRFLWMYLLIGVVGAKKMDSNTFTHPVIVKLMNNYFYAVKLDAESAEIIKYKGTDYKKANDRKQTPNDFASLMLNGKMSYPTTVYLDEALNSLGPVPGYLEPKTMEKILHYFGENYYKTISWVDYEKGFVSEIK